MATPKVDWVVTGGKPGEVAYCTRCGEGLTLSMPQRIEVFVGASKAFVKCHAKCPPGEVHQKPAKTPDEWAGSRDVGVSSATIWSVMTGRPSFYSDNYDAPYDPDDFGRCYRLLKLFPDWRKRMPEVAAKYPIWKGLVREWDRLTEMFENPKGRELYDLIQKLRKEA
jgi:hypothetical protein